MKKGKKQKSSIGKRRDNDTVLDILKSDGEEYYDRFDKKNDR